MSDFAYKWVSYTINGGPDRAAHDRALKRGWKPCPPAELPPLEALGLPHPDFRLSMRDFRLYRMPALEHSDLVASYKKAGDEALEREFKRFQSALAAMAVRHFNEPVSVVANADGVVKVSVQQ